MTKSEAGRLGGLTTVKRHGKEHMSRIGKLGAKVLWTNYVLIPVGTSYYKLVRRETCLA